MSEQWKQGQEQLVYYTGLQITHICSYFIHSSSSKKFECFCCFRACRRAASERGFTLSQPLSWLSIQVAVIVNPGLDKCGMQILLVQVWFRKDCTSDVLRDTTLPIYLGLELGEQVH